FRKLPVGISEIERDRALRLRPTAAHFRDEIFEAVRQIDAPAKFLAGDRIDDGLAALLDQPRYDKPRAPLVDVDGKLDVGEDGRVHGSEHRCEDAEDRGAGFRVLAADDAKNGVALRLARPFVHDRLRLAVSEMDRPRPGKDAGKAQTVERGFPVMAGVDLHADHRLAIAMRRQRIELAGAAISAIAVGEFTPFEHPFGHLILPVSGWRQHLPRRRNLALRLAARESASSM